MFQRVRCCDLTTKDIFKISKRRRKRSFVFKSKYQDNLANVEIACLLKIGDATYDALPWLRTYTDSKRFKLCRYP